MAPVMRTDVSASDRASIALLRRPWTLTTLQRSTDFRQSLERGFALAWTPQTGRCCRSAQRLAGGNTSQEASMGKAFDVIVVGARCAGSATAMLLARKGYRVLTVDRASFPSDTVSTHLVHPRAVNALSRWGLLDRLVATGCPPIHTYAFDFGAFTIAGAPGTDRDPVAYCPRRT